MPLTPLSAISPVDGRYRRATEPLAAYLSEGALIRYRVATEIAYFLALCDIPLPPLAAVTRAQREALQQVIDAFSEDDAGAVKAIERTTNHDVKAVEYFLKERFDVIGMGDVKEFIHFALTSQDINNTALPASLRDAWKAAVRPTLVQVMDKLSAMADDWADVAMLARTHGQPASPTRLGKEIRVFVERLAGQLALVDVVPFTAKFGGATGNFNAHHAAYPDIDWAAFADRLVNDVLGLVRISCTTQIEPYDHLAAFFNGLQRINTILIDLCRDIWAYISINTFRQRVVAGEVGSSTMPHKVNPIDFENAEGNLGIANAGFAHLAGKLPVSRWQRDLTDSTATRFIGVPLGHMRISLLSLLRGLDKLTLDSETIARDLEENWAVVTEGIQTILRREGYPEPYEALKALTRGHRAIDREAIHAFVDSLDVDDAVKAELRALSPATYLGIKL
jgi:adenylosuccinate lyase